jgi:hypothetical protein
LESVRDRPWLSLGAEEMESKVGHSKTNKKNCVGLGIEKTIIKLFKQG